MSFVAHLAQERHLLLWAKSVLALTLVSDDIKFVISEKSITISAVNSTNTSDGDISFERDFFDEYHVSFDGTISHGFDIEDATYSFIVSSNHLSILFKTLDTDSLIKLRVNFDNEFRMLIDITRKLIVKKYQIGYQPVKNQHDPVWKYYVSEHQRQQNILPTCHDSDIKYIRIDHKILKEFVDLVPQQTEEFKIEVKSNKISFNGFTKMILKDNQYLKQPMSITISLNLYELADTNMPPEFNQRINFKLKFFKIFINLISFISLHKLDQSEEFEIYFKAPGDPVLFTLRSTRHVCVHFVQLTNDEAGQTENLITQNPIMKSYKLEEVGRNSSKYATGALTHSTSRSTISRPNLLNPAKELTGDNGSYSDLEPEVDQFNVNFDDESEVELGATQHDEVRSIFD